MDQKILYQIYKACRLCGIGDGYKMPIIQNFIDLDETDIHLKKKIADSLQIQVPGESVQELEPGASIEVIEVIEGDKMPPLICELCVDKVDDFFAFKERCKQISELTQKKLGLPAQETKPEVQTVKEEREDSPKRDIKKEKALAKRESDIKIKETKLKERDIELKSRDKALRVKEIDLKQRDAELKQKEAAVKVKETQVKNKDSQLKSFDAILRNKDVELTLRQNQIKSKEQELQQLEELKNQKLKERELALKKKETELKKKEGILKKLEAESRRKIEAERAELKKESLKRTREVEIEEPVQKSRTSRSSSVSSKPSKVPRRSEDRPDSGRNSRSLAANAASGQEPQQELATKLTRSKERDIPETPPPPDKKPKVSPKSAKPTSAAKTPEQDHQCVVCSVVFKTLKTFKNHLRSHYVNTNPKYVCNPCHLWFTNSEEMLSHQREHKVNGLRYKCTNCEFSFTTEKDYQEHFTKLDCYIYTVPDVQCGSCWRLFATETLKSQHPCPGEDARGPGTCTSCSETFEFLKDLKEHEVSCTGKPEETNLTVNEAAAPLADVKEHEVANSSKTRGPENVLADTEVLASLRPVQVRTEKCDALTTNSIEDSVNVSNVDYNYGLDKTCVYPYFTLYPRIKQEPGFNYFQGMVRINEDVRNEFLLEDYIHWDSEESENECSDVKKRGEKVKTLAQLSLKVIFSKKLIGKVPRKRRKIKNEIQSVLNVSLFDLGANCFDFSENMDEGNESVNNIIANLGRDDNSGKEISKDAKNQNVNDKNDNKKIGSDKNENCAGGSNKTINIPEHSNDVSLYEEYIESKNNEEQQSRSNCEVDSKTTDQGVEANEGKRNDSDDENSSGDRTKSVNNINAYDVQNNSDSSNNSIKDVNTEMTSETSIESKIENENIASRNSEEQQSSLNSEPINNEFDSNKNDSNEDNASEKPKSEDENNLNVFQNISNAPLINNSVQSDVTDVTEELKSKTNDSMVMKCTEKALDSLEPNKSDQISYIVVSDSHENGDLNDMKPFTENAKTNIETSDDNKYNFITHTNNCIPFFESDNETKIHSNEENIEIQTQRNEKLHCKSDIAENNGKNEEGAEMEKLFSDLNELSQDSNSSVTTDKQNKTKDVEMDDGRLMAELNKQIGEDTDKTQVKDSVHSKTVESNVYQDSIDSVNKRSPSLDDVSDADSVNKRSPSLDDVSDADSNFD